MDLRTIDLYLKRRAMAESPGGNANEKAMAARQLREMEAEYPGLREKAEAVAGAMAGERGTPGDVGAETSSWGGGLAAFLKATAKAAAGEAASQFADNLSGGLSGAERFSALDRREVAFTAHACTEGQVCLEVRVRAADVLRVRTRKDILAEIEDELVEMAEEAR